MNIKDKQLGMSASTAQHRLRILIMFQLVQQANRDTCFKCNQKINSPEELSIEHKKPWLHVSPELFWDLGNIAFSHRKCNKAERPKGGIGKRKIGPEGTSWCTRHQQFLPVEQFWKDSLHWNGYNSNCISCHNISKENSK